MLYIIKGAFASLVITLLLILAVSVVSYFAGMSEDTAGIVLFAVSAVSVFAGSLMIARAVDGKRLVNCVLSAALYLLVVFSVSWIVHRGFAFGMHFVTTLVSALLASAAGCLIGGRR